MRPFGKITLLWRISQEHPEGEYERTSTKNERRVSQTSKALKDAPPFFDSPAPLFRDSSSLGTTRPQLREKNGGLFGKTRAFFAKSPLFFEPTCAFSSAHSPPPTRTWIEAAVRWGQHTHFRQLAHRGAGIFRRLHEWPEHLTPLFLQSPDGSGTHNGENSRRKCRKRPTLLGGASKSCNFARE